jgi:hypothetical protein
MIFDLATLAMAFMAYTSTATAQLTPPVGEYNIYSSASCEASAIIGSFQAGVSTIQNDCIASCVALSFDQEGLTTQISVASTGAVITCRYYTNPTFQEPGPLKSSSSPCGLNTNTYSQLQSSNSECQIVPPPPGVTLTTRNETAVPVTVGGVVCYANDCLIGN